MATPVGFQFTADDRKLLESLSRFEKGLEDIRSESKKLGVDTAKAFKDITKSINDAEKKSSGFRNVFGGVIAADVVREAARSVKNLGLEAIGAAASYEKVTAAFGNFLGSADKANRLLAQLTQTAAETPFEQEDIFNAARQLLAFGTAQEDVNQKIKELGDIAAGVQQPLGRIVLIFGQIQAKGKLTGEELLQLREAGVNPLKELAEVIGVAEAEIEGLVSKGKVSSEAVAKAFELMTTAGGRFEGQMASQSKTFEGVVSNFRDQFNITLRQFGEELLPTLKAATNDAIEFLKTLDPDKIKSFAQGILSAVKTIASFGKQIALITAGYVAGTVAQRAFAAGTALLTGGIKGLSAAIKLNPIGLIASAVAFALPHIITLTKRLQGTTKAMEEMQNVTKGLRTDFRDQVKVVEDLIDVLRSHTSTEQERKAAISSLNQLYPDILAKYDIEKGSIQDLIDLNAELKNSILDRISEERRADITRRTLSDIEDIQASKPTFTLQSTGRLAFVATEADQERDRQSRIEKRLKQEEEEISILNKSLDVLRERATVSEHASEEEQNAADAAAARRKALLQELELLSSKELRAIAKTADVDELRANTARDILKAREAEARATAANAKELEKAQAALEKYHDAVKKIAEGLKKNQIDSIENPFQKLAAQKDLALEQVQILFDELRKQAKEVGADVTDLEKLEADSRLQVQREYYHDLQELRKKDREDKLRDFLDSSQLRSDSDVQSIRTSTKSDGVNTKDELVRVNVLEREREQLEENASEIVQRLGIFSAEAQQALIDYNAKVAELDQARLANRDAVLDREEQHLLNEVDLIQRSADNTLTLEEYKERKRLEIALEFAKKRLALLPEDSVEAMQLKDSIAAIESELNSFADSNVFDKLKDKIAEAFNIPVGTLNHLLSGFGEIFNASFSYIQQQTQAQIEAQDEILEAIRERIDETQDALDQELADQENGFAANVDSKKAELETLRAEEKKHQQLQLQAQKAAIKQKLYQDSLSQISSLITMVAQVTEAHSSQGIIGVPIALAAIAAFIGIFSAFKASSKQLAAQQSLFKGGRIPKEGRTDKNGARGHRVQDTNIVVGAGEHITNADASELHDQFLTDLNDGKYDHINLDKLLAPLKKEPIKVLPPISREIAQRIEKQNTATISARAKSDRRMYKEVMTEVMREHAETLMRHADEKPNLIPLTEDTIGYIEKSKGHTRNHRFTS